MKTCHTLIVSAVKKKEGNVAEPEQTGEREEGFVFRCCKCSSLR